MGFVGKKKNIFSDILDFMVYFVLKDSDVLVNL